jgi:hypothetical protein
LFASQPGTGTRADLAECSLRQLFKRGVDGLFVEAEKKKSAPREKCPNVFTSRGERNIQIISKVEAVVGVGVLELYNEMVQETIYLSFPRFGMEETFWLFGLALSLTLSSVLERRLRRARIFPWKSRMKIIYSSAFVSRENHLTVHRLRARVCRRDKKLKAREV